MSQLMVYRNGSFESEHDVTKDKIALGRHSENDVVLNDLTMSRFHARIERRASDYVIVDLNAQNGVLLNGSKVEGESNLSNGDRLTMGLFEIHFEAKELKKTAQQPKVLPEEPFDTTTDFDIYRSSLEKGSSNSGTSASQQSLSLGSKDTNTDTHMVEDKTAQPCFALMYNAVEMDRFLLEGEVIIGRAESCNITIPLVGLSRRHARVFREKNRVMIEDNKSQNGTWVDYKRIEKPTRITYGDTINFYEYTLVFCRSLQEKVKLPDNNPTVLTNLLENSDSEVERLSEESQSGASDLDEDAAGLVAEGSPEEGPSAGEIDSASASASAADTAQVPVQNEAIETHSLANDDESEDADTNFVFGAGSFIEEENLKENSRKDVSQLSENLISSLGDESFPEFESEQTDGDASIADEPSTEGIGAAKKSGEETQDPESKKADDVTRGPRPSELELELVLRQVAVTPFFRVEVYLDGHIYTQIPLSQPIVRLGTDARCELAIPRVSDLRPWHLTFFNYGAHVMCSRASSESVIELDGVSIDAVVLRNEDTLNLGKITLVFKEG